MVQTKIPDGVVRSDIRMAVAVQRMAMVVPVIEEIVVQQCCLHELGFVSLQMQQTVQPEAFPRDADAVFISRRIAMLYVLFHAKDPGVFLQILQETIQILTVFLFHYSLLCFFLIGIRFRIRMFICAE